MIVMENKPSNWKTSSRAGGLRWDIVIPGMLVCQSNCWFLRSSATKAQYVQENSKVNDAGQRHALNPIIGFNFWFIVTFSNGTSVES